MNSRLKKKTAQIPDRDYFMTVYENGDGYFSEDGTVDTAAPLADLEPYTEVGRRITDLKRTSANMYFRYFYERKIFENVPWE